MSAGSGALDVLRAIKALGVYVAVDDFGTGYSSLAALKLLPVEVLRSTAPSSTGSARSRRTRRSSVMSLAHAMGLHVIAEGIETPLQASELTALGWTVGQG
jgi:EAL domain-containing protein (putative c-di-GMP-specific phosphodiesterase class I)